MSTTKDKVTERNVAKLSIVVLSALVVGGVVYAVLVLLAFVQPAWIDVSRLAPLKSVVEKNVGAAIGIPLSAVSAYSIVTGLLHAFPTTGPGGVVTFDAFGMKFTGPAVPTTLWLTCFVAFVAAIKLLS